MGNGRLVLRPMLALVCLVVALTVIGDFGMRSASATRSENVNEENIQTWNMCQGAEHCPERYTQATVNRLYNTVVNAQRKPQFISLQEVCYSLWDNIKQALDEWYQGVFKSSHNTGGTCDRHGNGILWRGGCSGTLADCTNGGYYTDQEHPINQADPLGSGYDVRNFLCAMSRDRYFYGCGTHLENDSYWASQQQYELRMHTNQAIVYQAAYAAGDFNLPPNQGYFNGWTGNYVEGDDCSPACQWTFAGAVPVKFDWAWADDGRCNRVHDAHTLFVTESDHAWYRAYLDC